MKVLFLTRKGPDTVRLVGFLSVEGIGERNYPMAHVVTLLRLEPAKAVELIGKLSEWETALC